MMKSARFWQFIIDVSGQPIGAVFTSLSRNVGKELPLYVTSQKSAELKIVPVHILTSVQSEL